MPARAMSGVDSASVAAEQHRGLPFRDRQVDAVQDVVAPDVRLDAREAEQGAHAAFSPNEPR
jgi:hypothetical protein